MRAPRPIRLLALAALAAAALVAPSAADPLDVLPGGVLASPNVTYVATIPLDAPGIGGRVLTVGTQRRFYVSGAKGLTVYDVSIPYAPVVIGELPLPHLENESLAVSDDGATVIITSDPDFGQPPVTYVVDTSLVTAPRIASVIPEGSHPISCANEKCSHVYASSGWTYDIRDRTKPKPVTPGWGAVTRYRSAHYLSRDAAGFLSTGLGMIDPRRDPERPKQVNVRSGGWHNSLRPYADKWRPRGARDTSPLLRPGELHIGGGETWLAKECDKWTAGVETWSVAGFDKGRNAEKRGELKPKAGTWTDGNPAANVIGCSSHWFDYRKGVVAGGWYDHGVRFLRVDLRTGAISLAGWYQPVATESWAAYWVDDTYVYSVDAVRGIDILRFERDVPAPSKEAGDRSWRRISFQPTAATVRERNLCRLSAPDPAAYAE